MSTNNKNQKNNQPNKKGQANNAAPANQAHAQKGGKVNENPQPKKETKVPVETEVVDTTAQVTPEVKTKPVGEEAKPKVATGTATAGQKSPFDFANFSEKDHLSPDGKATMYAALQRQFGGKPHNNDPKIIIAGELLDYTGMIFLAQLAMQATNEGQKISLVAANPDHAKALLTELAEAGINAKALPISSEKNTQLGIEFGATDIDKNLKKGIAEDMKNTRKEVAIVPAEWVDDENKPSIPVAQRGIAYILGNNMQAGSSFETRVMEAVEKYEEFQKMVDPAYTTEGLTLGDRICNLVKFTNTKGTVLISGLGNTITNILNVKKNAIPVHCCIRKQFTKISEEEVASLAKALITLKLELDGKSEAEIDNTLLKLKAADRDTLLKHSAKQTDEDKEICGRVIATYHSEIIVKDKDGKIDPEKLPFYLANKFFTIANYYREPEQKIALIEQSKFADELAKVLSTAPEA